MIILLTLACGEAADNDIDPLAAQRPELQPSQYDNGEFAGIGVKVQQLPANNGLWNLDRIDQISLPLDNKYRWGSLRMTCWTSFL